MAVFPTQVYTILKDKFRMDLSTTTRGGICLCKHLDRQDCDRFHIDPMLQGRHMQVGRHAPTSICNQVLATSATFEEVAANLFKYCVLQEDIGSPNIGSRVRQLEEELNRLKALTAPPPPEPEPEPEPVPVLVPPDLPPPQPLEDMPPAAAPPVEEPTTEEAPDEPGAPIESEGEVDFSEPVGP